MLRFRPLQRIVIRGIVTRPTTKVSEDPEDTFGTLSRTGSKSLAVHSTEREHAEDPEGYDEEGFDLAPRKNAYYYKYEISKYARKGEAGIRKALELFQTMKSKDRLKPTVDNYSPLIYGCAKSGYTKRAFDLYIECQNSGEKPPHSHITCLINACAECPFPEYGIERLKWLRDHLRVDLDRSLNVIQYNALIKAYGKLGQLGEASKVVQEMIQEKIYPNMGTIVQLLVGCTTDKENGTAIALRVFKRMRLYGMKPEIHVFELMLKCIRDCGMGTPELMRQILDELPALTVIDERLRYKSRHKRNSTQHFEWMPLLSDLGQSIDTALNVEHSTPPKVKLIEEGPQAGKSMVTPPSISEDSLTFYHEAEASPQIAPNLLSDDHLELTRRIQDIDFGKLNYPDARLMLFGGIRGYLEMMKKFDCKPNSRTFTTLIGCIHNKPSARLQILRLAKEYSIERDSVFYNILFKHTCSDIKNPNRLEEALGLLEVMQQDNVRPDIATFEHLATACNTVQKARKLIEDVEQCGFIVSQKMFNNLFKAAIYDHNLGLLNLLIRLSLDRKYKPRKLIVEKLEELRLDCHDLVIKIEKDLVSKEDLPAWCGKYFVEHYDQFSKAFGYWSKELQIEEEEHPWSQFNVKTGSKRQGFVEFEKTFRALDRAKRDALKRGGNMNILFDEIKQQPRRPQQLIETKKES